MTSGNNSKVTVPIDIPPFAEIPIESILPQREPFIMADCLLHYDEMHTSTALTVRANNLFVGADGQMQAEGLIECVAQTCAARIGYYYKYILHRGILPGYIGSVTGFEVLRLPHVGETVATLIEVLDEVFQITRARACISVDGETIATTEMKICLSEDENGEVSKRAIIDPKSTDPQVKASKVTLKPIDPQAGTTISL